MKKATALLLALCLIGVTSSATAGAATATVDDDTTDGDLAPNCTGPPETQPICQATCAVIEKATGQPCY